MAAPSGYSAAPILDDKFSGTSLDTSHWSTVPGQLLTGPWGESTTAGGVVVNNGLTLTNNGSGVYGMVDTANPATGQTLFAFPNTGFYVQVKAKVTDTSNGFFPAIWFPPADDSAPYGQAGWVDGAPEIDVFEGGVIDQNNTSVPYNQVWEGNFGGGYAYWPGFRQSYAQIPDQRQNWTTYGVEWIPGVSATYYVNGVQVFQQLQSDPWGINATTSYPYQLLITPQGAPCSGSGNNGWHSCGVGTGSMYIAEVQVYSR